MNPSDCSIAYRAQLYRSRWHAVIGSESSRRDVHAVSSYQSHLLTATMSFFSRALWCCCGCCRWLAWCGWEL